MMMVQDHNTIKTCKMIINIMTITKNRKTDLMFMMIIRDIQTENKQIHL